MLDQGRQWNSVFFAFWLIIEGPTEKKLQCIIQLKSIFNKNLDFIEQKMDFFNPTERFKQEKVY